MTPAPGGSVEARAAITWAAAHGEVGAGVAVAAPPAGPTRARAAIAAVRARPGPISALPSRYPAARFRSNGGTTRYCACTQTSGVRLSVASDDPHQSKELWTLVELPATTSTFDLRIGNFSKLTSVPVIQ